MRSPKRHWPWILAAVLAAVAVAYLYGTRRAGTKGPAEQLIREANRLAQARYPRPVHVVASRRRSGSFGQALAAVHPRLAALHRWQKKELGQEKLELARAVARGDRPVADLPADFIARLAGYRPVLQALRRTTHAERGDPADGLGALADPDHPMASGGWAPVISGARLLALRAYLHLAAAEPAPAVEICLDGLGLARDAGVGTGLIGRMIGVALQGMFMPCCAAALDAAPPASSSRALDQLAGIARVSAPFGPVIAQDAVATQLLAFASLLGDAHLARLPPAARAMVDKRDSAGRSLVGEVSRSVLTWHAWERYLAMIERVQATMALPPAKVAPRLREQAARVRESINPMVSMMGGVNYLKYWRRHRRGIQELGLLGLAILVEQHRVAHGEWPKELTAARAELSRRGMTIEDPLKLKRLPDGRLRLKLLADEARQIVLAP